MIFGIKMKFQFYVQRKLYVNKFEQIIICRIIACANLTFEPCSSIAGDITESPRASSIAMTVARRLSCRIVEAVVAGRRIARTVRISSPTAPRHRHSHQIPRKDITDMTSYANGSPFIPSSTTNTLVFVVLAMMSLAPCSTFAKPPIGTDAEVSSICA